MHFVFCVCDDQCDVCGVMSVSVRVYEGGSAGGIKDPCLSRPARKPLNFMLRTAVVPVVVCGELVMST